MVRVMDETVNFAAARFFEQPAVAGAMEFLNRRLPSAARIFVAGGAIRNLVIGLMHGNAPPTRDIDIFLGGLNHRFTLTTVLNDQKTWPTDLGGLRWRPEPSVYHYDLCLLTNFIVIRTYHLEPTLSSLLAGIDLTINAIAYDYRSRILYESGCLEAIRKRIIDFNSPWIPDKRLIAYRLGLMAHKTGFRFSETVFQFLTRQMDVETLVQLKRLLQVKLGKQKAKTIMRSIDRLCRYATHAKYLQGMDEKEGFL